MHVLEGLNPAQREAVEAADGPLLILAGPGSGKTRVIVHRVAYLIDQNGIPPYAILAVTFTNKAARELRERLDVLIGRRAEQVTAGTFHAICARWLRRDGRSMGINPGFTIYDENDQVDLVKAVLRELEVDEGRFSARSVLNTISAAKSALLGPDEYGEHARGPWQQLTARVYRRYQELLRQNQALDFDDLLVSTVELFRQDAETLERYQDRYRYILVDEFQDTNPVQYALVKLLGSRHRNVCAVGDPDQSIYAFRAADIRNVFNFERDFPELRVVTLEQNYRSTQTILDVAHSIIAANRMRKEKNLWTENARGAPVLVHEAYDERDEALFVVRQIERHVARGGSYGDLAVMYRVNAQSRALEDTFVRAGLPYRLVGGTRFYERKEVKDVLAYLRLVNNPHDSVSLTRILNVPPRGIGAKTVAELGRWARESGASLYETIVELSAEPSGDGPIRLSPVTPRARQSLAAFRDTIERLREEREHSTVLSLLDRLLERTGYARFVRDGTEEGEERSANIMELRTKALDYDELDPSLALSSFLEEVSLVQAVDNMQAEQNAVTLITLHQAKGLEFSIVFIVGLEEGLCPHTRSFDDVSQTEEERRLLYVGVTRAMRELYLLYAFRRTLYGGQGVRTPSRFLTDIPAALTNRAKRKVASGQWRVASESPRPRGPERAFGLRPAAVGGPATRHPPLATAVQTQFHAGDRVSHPGFGSGIVVSSQLTAGDEVVTVVFEGKGLKKLSLSYAPLERT